MIVYVQENCNRICAKIIFAKFVMSVHPCRGKVDTATLSRGSSTICLKLLEGTSSLQDLSLFRGSCFSVCFVFPSFDSK